MQPPLPAEARPFAKWLAALERAPASEPTLAPALARVPALAPQLRRRLLLPVPRQLVHQ